MTSSGRFDDETVRVLYEHGKDAPARQVASGDAIDSKTVQIFGAASVVLGLGSVARIHGWATVAYVTAVVAYLVAADAARRIITSRNYRVTDTIFRYVSTSAEKDYRTYPPAPVVESLVDELVSATRENAANLDEKARPLDRLIAFTACEAVLVAIAVTWSLAA